MDPDKKSPKLKNGLCNHLAPNPPIKPPPMPWFGMDIGGTLAKLVYFEPTNSEELEKRSTEDKKTIANIAKYLTTNRIYGESGHRDEHLQKSQIEIGGCQGTLHFIRFPTNQMHNFIRLAKDKGMADLASTVCATGGGAYKFENDIQSQMKMRLNKFDEIDSLVRGVEFMVKNNDLSSPEVFYFTEVDDQNGKGVKKYYDMLNGFYPFLLVNIGSGVSILSVRGPEEFERVYGTSLGGGTFLGLCCLLTKCTTFEEALELAANGDNKKVDKLVRDIYGGDYEKFGLTGDTVASSFGQMNLEEKRSQATKADLARATLVTITNNIGSIARLCARAEKIERVVFVGNFLRINPIAMTLLAKAMEYWSQGDMKALFCKHEGYFGAVGCLLELMKTHRSRSPSPRPESKEGPSTQPESKEGSSTQPEANEGSSNSEAKDENGCSPELPTSKKMDD